MVSKVYSSCYQGIDPYLVEVEVDITQGLPGFYIVGLGDTTVNESKERVKSAIKNSKYKFKARKMIVNLSPAGIKKGGASLDLPIAIGILSGLEEIKREKLKDYVIIGELSLTGDVRRVEGAINTVICAKENKLKGVILPRENYLEGVMIKGIEIIPVDNLLEVVEFLNDQKKKEELLEKVEKKRLNKKKEKEWEIDLCEVKGQTMGKRGLEIAAAGKHNIYLVGTPGSGKTMLARRIQTILPKLKEKEMIESTKIYSSMGLLTKENGIIEYPPFRSPHHTTSAIALIGGGRNIKAGEITLAHNGVLFLDEVNEFSKKVLESLRQPLEDKKLVLTRANYRVEMPGNTLLVLTANPCSCGFLYEGNCSCSPWEVEKYQSKLSGPLLDRMDLYIEIQRLKKEELKGDTLGEKSAIVRKRVEKARKIQEKRFKGGKLNGEMSQKEIKKYCTLDRKVENILLEYGEIFGITGRGYDKVLKVARTIADLEGRKKISEEDILEALSFRKKRN